MVIKNVVTWPPANSTDLLARREFYLTQVYNTSDNNDNNDDVCNSDHFELTGTQRFLCNLMAPGSPCNGLLLFHGTGAMKTCTAVSICERFSASKRVFLISRPILHDNFMRTVFDPNRSHDKQCTGDVYVERAHGSTERAQQLVSARYITLGLIQFANNVAASTDRELVEMFGGSIVVIDEAHQLRGENAIVYNALSRVLRVCGDMKLLLLTATPMFNSPADILPLLNLLRDNDMHPGKPLVPSNFFTRLNGQWVLDKKGGGAEALSNAAKGYISYVKHTHRSNAFPTILFPSFNGDRSVMSPQQFPTKDIFGSTIPKSEALTPTEDWEICASKMTGTQLATYNNATKNIAVTDNNDEGNENDVDDVDDGDEEGKEGSFMGAQQLGNVTFPGDGVSSRNESGYNAFHRCFQHDRMTHRWVYRKSVPPFLSQTEIGKYACKIESIVDKIIKAGDNSLSLVYSRWIWSGIMPLAVALDHRGFVPFNPNTSIVNGSRATKRYAIISGLSDINDVKKVLKVARSDENKNGDLIRVVLITERGSEGVDFRFIRELHIMEPWYHMKKIGQVVGRAARHCSHALLPPKDRNVTIYLHATKGSNENETPDMRAYRISFLKEKSINEVEQIIQKTAIDYFPTIGNEHKRRTPPSATATRQVTMVSAQGKRSTITVKNLPPWRIPDNINVSDSTFDAARHVDLKRVSAIVRKELEKNKVCFFLDVCDKVQRELFKGSVGKHESWIEMVVDASLSDASASRRVDRIVPNSAHGSGSTVLLSHPSSRSESDAYIQLHNKKSVVASDPMASHGQLVDDMVVQRTSILNMWKFSNVSDTIKNATTDFVVDRLPRDALLSLASSRRSEFSQSLERAGIVIKYGKLVRVPSYGDGMPKWLCDDENSGNFRVCATGEIPPSKKKKSFTSSISSNQPKGLMGWSRRTHSYVFKSVTDSIPQGSECERTSSIKVNMLRSELRSILKENGIKADVNNPNTKQGICILLEIALRAFAPSKFFRPLEAELSTQRN